MSSSGDRPDNILVIGIGNPLRSDDGVGPHVAAGIDARHLPGVEIEIRQQLQLEDLERMLAYEQVILVDASVSGPPLDFRVVHKLSGQILSSSHHLSAELFVNLASTIYHKELQLRLCSIKGVSFEVGERLSAPVQKNASEAVELICRFIEKRED